MIKDIVVSLSVAPARDVAGGFAVSVAAVLKAHVTGIAFLSDPLPAFTTVGRLPEDVLEHMRSEREVATKESVGSFELAAERADVPFASRIVETGFIGAANFFGSAARAYDLAIVGQAEPDRPGPEELITEAALFDSGRPVLVVPYITHGGLNLDRVMVCWDGGRAAARAVGDAIPLLTCAKAVDILVIEGEPRKEDNLPGTELAHHLARHGLHVSVKRLPSGELDVANAILSHAADSTADLMVMGGYGHSRLREFILGGVTRDILTSMTIPVLMSH